MRLPIVLLLLLLAPSSLASQYPLDQAVQIIPRAEAKQLRRAGVRTTLDILTRGRTEAGRQQLAASSRLAPERVMELTALADLLRVRGIGPDVARLLTAVGVRTIADLQRADPSLTAQAILDVNKARRLSQNPPGAPSLAYWIRASRDLPIVLEIPPPEVH